MGDWEGKGEPEFKKNRICFNGHQDSKSFASQDGLLWPTKKADGIGIVGEDVADGNWCGGDMVNKRCVNEDGNGSYETFSIAANDKNGFPSYFETSSRLKGLVFGCCKTNYRPYDINVQCCLIALKEHFGDDVFISSDGGEELWTEAVSICQHVLGYGILFELDTDGKKTNSK